MSNETFTPGAIVVNSWGYEQTNIEFYRVVSRKNGFVTLIELDSVTEYDSQTMTGKNTPGEPKADAKAFRRKIHFSNGEEYGLAIGSCGYATLWNNKPAFSSHYA